MKHLIMYAKVARARVVKFVEINGYLVEGLFKGFDETWGARNVLCRRDRMKIV